MSLKVYEAYRVQEGLDPYPVLWEIQRRGRENIKRKLRKVFSDISEGISHAEHLKSVKQNKLFAAWLKEKYPGREDMMGLPLFRDYREWSETECPEEIRRLEGVLAVSNDEVFKKGKRPEKVGTDETPGVFDIDSWAKVMYGEQLARYERDLWALDVSVTVRVFDGRYYLIPYCDRVSLVDGVLEFMQDMEELEDFSYWNNTDRPEEVGEEEWEARASVWWHFSEGENWTRYLTLDVLSWETWSEVSPMRDAALEAVENMKDAT